MARARDDRDVLAYQQLEKVVPHTELFLSSEDVDIEGALDITECLRRHHLKWGRYRLAEQFGRKSLELAEKNFEPGHPTIAISQSNLATVLRDLGELKEARGLLTKAYEVFLKKLGYDHPYTKKVRTHLENIQHRFS